MALKNKLGYVFMLSGACFAASSMAGTFTDTYTVTVNSHVTGVSGGVTDKFNVGSLRVLTPPQRTTISSQGTTNTVTLTGISTSNVVSRDLAVQSNGTNMATYATGTVGSKNLELYMYDHLVQPTTHASNLSHATFGNWVLRPAHPAAGTTQTQSLTLQAYAGAGTGSSITPVANIPGYNGNATGSATYTGKIAGTALTSAAPYGLLGDLVLNVDFGTRRITGSATQIAVTNNNTGASAGNFNNLSIAATVTGNHFAGRVTTLATTGVTVGSANPTALAAGISGPTKGHFYGPTPHELAGVFRLATSGGKAIIGSFGAMQ